MPSRFLARAALLLTVACAPTAAPVPTEPPFIAGTVTAVGRIGEGLSVRVEERPTDISGSVKGVFRVGNETAVRRATGGRAPAEELREGQRVRVWVTGPVAESYPVQAQARLVVIDGEAP